MSHDAQDPAGFTIFQNGTKIGITLKEIQHERLQHVVLAHLSETNNTPQKALAEVSRALIHPNTKLDVATQDECGMLLYLK